jgi:tetratricopeptide (TPR) repeat protein
MLIPARPSKHLKEWFCRPACCSVFILVFLTTVAKAQDATPEQAPVPGGRADNAAKSQPEPGKNDERPKPSTLASSATPKPKPATPFLEGMELYRNEEFTSALSKYMEASNSGSGDTAAAYAWLARVELRKRQPEDAEAAARKALELNKDLPTAQSAMGEVYYREGKFPEAEDVFRKILLAKIDDPRASLGLARIYWATANHKYAKALIDHAHALDHRDPDIFWEWFGTLNRKERLEALKSRLAAGGGDDAEEQIGMQSMVAVLEDRERKPERQCKLVNKVESTEAKLESLLYDAKRLRGFGLMVKVNDKGARLLIDTGASGILINSKVAERSGVERIVNQDISGIGDKGAALGYIAFAHNIQIGDLQFENCYVDVVDRKNSLDEEGLIGMDVFEDFLVDLDFPNRRFRLSQLPPFPDEPAQSAGLHSSAANGPNLHNRYIPPAYSDFEKVYRIGHNLLVPTRLNTAPPKLFLLDTGAWDNTVTPAAAREAAKVYSGSDMKVKGLSGEVKKVYTTGDITLTFGKFQQQRHDLVAFDMKNVSDHAGTEISGTLGFDMLSMLEIKIDYRDHLVGFIYDPNRFH